MPALLLSDDFSAIGRLSGRLWRRILLLGLLLYAFTQGASFLALAHLPAVTVALMSTAWLGEASTGFQWLGVGLATVAGGTLMVQLRHARALRRLGRRRPEGPG